MQISLRFLATLLVWMPALIAHAQPWTPAVSKADITSFVTDRVHNDIKNDDLRVDIQVDDQALATQAADCRRIEPFAPAAGRLAGRTQIGLRCVDGAPWSRLVPITVSIKGLAWVATTSLSAGTVLAAADLQQIEVDLTRERPGLPRSPDTLIGKSLTRPVAAGQAVHPDWARAPWVVAAGDTVRLRMQGGGFSILAAGQSLGNATEGQSVRIRSDFGRTMTGTAREGRIVDIQP